MDSEEYSESDSSYEDISDESDSDEDTLDAARNWCRIDQENLAPPPPRFPFSGNPGLNTRMDGSSLIEFFCIFFDDDIVGYIASETNLYAEDFIEKNDLTPSSRVPKWKDVDSSEIRVFLGIIILQGIVQKPLQKWYWSQRPLLSTPYLKQLMSEKRFSIIMKFLHFTNNETIDLETHPQPGLRKVYEVYDAINRKFKSSYVPERDVSVDESLLLYKGRLGCKQYLPKKRARFGIKYYPTVRNQQKKYYLKIFRQILNQSVWNSFILYKKNGGTMSHLDFRLQLVEELAKIYGESKHSSQNTTSSDRINGRLFPSRIQPTQKKKAPTKICIVCSQKFNEKGQRVRKESRYQCAQCNVTLCVTPCFEKYHTVENF
ncbi:PiggyBac transposable element-derived protein 4 [Araneus ventricosus]|uniref:PiggyBac transposable element-derived protein 4 n=1 Tax=Araneus ventricosus TaxID=182803 RepID=A0A4Y2GJR3_ARAVE|nr:PiggyBac transposable element-derived protein 4 [Araneus ventricosus]